MPEEILEDEIARAEARLAETGIRRLSPSSTVIFKGIYNLLHCVLDDKELYRGVFAIRMFPIRSPNLYISLHYTGADDKEHEIGVIEDLSTYPQAIQDLINASLADHYYEQMIHRVYEIECEHGLLFFDVETQRGREKFVMHWRGDRAEDYGRKGKVLHDALDNRYVIRDVEALPSKDQSRFLSYIYW